MVMWPLGARKSEILTVPFRIPLLDIRHEEYRKLPTPEAISDWLNQRNHVLMKAFVGKDGLPEFQILMEEWVLYVRTDRQEDRFDVLVLSRADIAQAKHKVDFLQNSFLVEVHGWELRPPRPKPPRSPNRQAAMVKAIQHMLVNSPEASVPLNSDLSEMDKETGRLLDDLNSLVDIEYELEQEKQRGAGRATYTRIDADTRERTTHRITYRFHVEPGHDLESHDFVEVELRNGDKIHGEIVEIVDGIITVGFRTQFNFDDLLPYGLLSPIVNQTQYTVRKNVLRELAAGTSPADYFLPMLAKAQFREPESSGGITEPPPHLTTSQQQGVVMGSRNTGMVFIQGPPGTGKTTVIAEWVEHFVRNNQRVLISSQSNMAVDNVLERFLDKDRLSEDLADINVVRVGHEDKVLTSVQGALLDNRAKQFQKQFLEQSRQGAKGFLKYQETVNELLKLRNEAQELELKINEETDAITQITKELHEIETYLDEKVISPLESVRAKIKQLDQKRHRLATRLTQVEKSTFFSILLAPIRYVWKKRLVNFEGQLTDARCQEEEGQTRAEDLHAEIAGMKRSLADREISLELAKVQWDSVTKQSWDLIIAVDDAQLPPGFQVGESNFSTYNEAASTAYAWAERVNQVLDVISDWHELLGSREQSLYRLVLQLVDVVGGTCIGINSNRHFSDLDFGVTIVDEAGQIQVHDVMVPLSRSPQAILVGDHLQLPPVVADGVIERIEEAELDPNIAQQSLFEQLYEIAPDSTKVMLDTQFRMPAEIADFISDQFYMGQYKSHESKRAQEALLPLFKRPFVLVDTSPSSHRREKFLDPGYKNILEARLVASIVRYSIMWGLGLDQLGVIAPYKAQADLVYELLTTTYKVVDETGILRDNIASVDAFQGQERELIVYSFTRSNPQGRIGFLSELRRLNVALTRPKRQLVVVGDFSTLQNADDERFSEMARALVRAVKENGDYMDLQELRERLATQTSVA